jgi:flagellar biogenesis protein FliO
MIWIVRKGKISAQGWINAAKRPYNELNVISRHALTPQHAIYLVSIAGQVYVVATHPQGLQILQHPIIQPVRSHLAGTEEKGTK